MPKATHCNRKQASEVVRPVACRVHDLALQAVGEALKVRAEDGIYVAAGLQQVRQLVLVLFGHANAEGRGHVVLHHLQEDQVQTGRVLQPLAGRKHLFFEVQRPRHLAVREERFVRQL